MNKRVRIKRADGEATRKKILETAGELFAARGFADTTNKMIAAEADVDLASINYHFGSRKGLHYAVLVEAHSRLINMSDLQELASNNNTAHEKLKQFITFMVDKSLNEAGWPVMVFSREFYSPSSHLNDFQMEEILPKTTLFAKIVSEITSIPAHDLAINQCLICVVAPCLMMTLLGPLKTEFINQLMNLDREEKIETIYTFAIAGLEAVSTRYKKQASAQKS